MNIVVEDRKGCDAYTTSQLCFEDACNFIILRREDQWLKTIYSNTWRITAVLQDEYSILNIKFHNTNQQFVYYILYVL
jgi:hypothetical protein